MKNFHSLSLLFLSSFFLVLSSSNSMSLLHLSLSPSQTQKRCLDDQKSALLQLQQELRYAPPFTFSSKAKLWDANNSDCCSWNRVSCDATGHVIGLDLSYNNLSGSFHSVFKLHHLRSLNLAGNCFNTTLFQYDFDRLPNLTHLDISNSSFHGQIPIKISYLTRLESLNLSYQYDYYWRIFDDSDYTPTLKLEKPNLKELVQNMSYLTELYLDSVNISSDSSKWCETISLSLPNLRVLSMNYCGLTGPFCSSLSKLHSLSHLHLRGNSLSYLPPNFLEISSHLVSLNLAGCNLSGDFPSQVFSFPKIQHIEISFNEALGGQFSEFALNSSLQVLRLRITNFSGRIPESICNLKLLTKLDIRDSHFHEPIPQSMFQLPRLQYLYIGYNSFASTKLDMYFQLKQLRGLDLSNVSLSIGSSDRNLTFPQLEHLYLSSCNLSEFPEFIKAQDKLVGLDLSENYIHGFVPNWLWKPTLQFLSLSSNAIIDFPKQFPFGDANSSFPMLRWLQLQHCNLSRFPEFLKRQEKLEDLDLSNNIISGTVPNWMWKRSLWSLDLSNNHLSSLDQFSSNHSQTTSPKPICKLTRLELFNMSYNNLSGPVPTCFSKFSTLSILDLQRNNFTGILPNFAARLQILKVGENSLEGKLPRSLAKCTWLIVLDVRQNKMQDTFPFWLEKLPALTVLVLQGNRFYGPIKFRHGNPFPVLDVLDIASNEFLGVLSSIDFLQATQLKSIKMGGNKLEGKLPRSLANFTKLEVLDVGHNMIHDTFPSWLEKLPSLKVLILRGNRFFGTINTTNVFPLLRILDIASNNFSGELSTKFLQDLTAMMLVTDGSKNKSDYIGQRDYYQDSVTIVNKGNELFYEKVLTLLTCLDLSSNNFHGRIPEEIRNLKSLMVLNLSRNSFSGRIPLALENLKKLESLDLSNNSLLGKIPPQLTSLTFLAALNLSYNQLEGSIPQSYQFSTFSNDSYRGNPKLCGPPLTRKCDEVDVAMQPQRDDVGHSWVDVISIWKIALIGYGSGIAVGFFLGYTVLNELGNKWVDRFTRNGKRNRRRRR